MENWGETQTDGVRAKGPGCHLPYRAVITRRQLAEGLPLSPPDPHLQPLGSSSVTQGHPPSQAGNRVRALPAARAGRQAAATGRAAEPWAAPQDLRGTLPPSRQPSLCC